VQAGVSRDIDPVSPNVNGANGPFKGKTLGPVSFDLRDRQRRLTAHVL
jgi:hypothetical protein